MKITPLSPASTDVVATLMAKLWPEADLAELREECAALLQSTRDACFLADVDGAPAGFVHVSLRFEYVEGAETSPTGYIEGIYVEPEFRLRGLATDLIAAAESWCRERGCREIASDSVLGNEEGIAFHQRAGFREVNRVVCFLKPL